MRIPGQTGVGRKRIGGIVIIKECDRNRQLLVISSSIILVRHPPCIDYDEESDLQSYLGSPQSSDYQYLGSCPMIPRRGVILRNKSQSLPHTRALNAWFEQ